MRRLAVIASLAFAPVAGAHAANPSVVHPVYRNIASICGGQKSCIDRQWRGMQRAFAYMRNKGVPVWKIDVCNRNATRKSRRIDWIGFDNCIRNTKLRRPR